MDLHQAQLQIARDRHRFRVCCCGRRFGKALALDTPIITANGKYKALVDIEVGDIAFDEKGQQTKVLYKSPIYYNRNCFLVEFSDGTSIIADASHDWVVDDNRTRKNRTRNKIKETPKLKLTTEEMYKNGTSVKRPDSRFQNKYTIDYTLPLQFDSISDGNLPLEPYFLGLWLGDGTSTCSEITTVDGEIIKYLREFAERENSELKLKEKITYRIKYKGKKNKDFKKKIIQSRLKELGVIENKHIPNIYLYASVEDRMELLRGLMDSDGTGSGGNIEYVTTSEKLANNFETLLIGLGIKHSRYKALSKYYGKICGIKHRFYIRTKKQIFKLKRKKEDLKIKQKKDGSERIQIKKITPIKSVPVQCLMVDAESHLFLAGKGCIPTHNTFLSVEEIKGKALLTDNAQIAYIAPTFQQARDIIWNDLKKELQPVAIKINESRLEIIIRNNLGSTSQILLRGWESVETLRGQKFHFLVLDEVAKFRNFISQWEAVLMPTLLDYTGEVMFISTPRGFNFFYDLYNEENKNNEFKSFHFTSYDNPFMPHDEIDKVMESMSKDKFDQEYLAEFRKMSGLVFPEFSRQNHLFDDDTPDFRNMKEFKSYRAIIGGCDFGYSNPSAVLQVYVDKENNFWVANEWYHEKKATDDIADVSKAFNIERLYADPAEPDRIEKLKEMGVNIGQVNKHVKDQTEAMRVLFKQNRIRIHKRNCPNLVWELEQYHYPEDKTGTHLDDKPVKENDHAIDGLKYCVTSYNSFATRRKKSIIRTNTRHNTYNINNVRKRLLK